jgi:hypothetical protein
MLAGNTRSHLRILALIRGEFGSNAGGLRVENSPASINGGVGPVLHPAGVHTPGERQHVGLDCRTTDALGRTPGPPSGSRRPHAFVAAWNCGSLAVLWTWLLGHTPLRLGSGKSDTPCVRMQREKATASLAGDVRVFADVDEGRELPPHAATSTARQTMAMTTVTNRARGWAGDGRALRRRAWGPAGRRPVNAARRPTEPARLSGAGGGGIGRSQC